jgi:TolA-binding protein
MLICPRTYSIFLAISVVVIAASSLPATPADDQFAVAASHYDAGRWKEAVEEFRLFLHTYPADPRRAVAEFYLGEALLQLSEFGPAREQFQKYLELEPAGRHARAALFRRGEAAYLAGKHAEAKADLDAFVQKHPDDKLNAFVLAYLGEIALAGGDAAAATALFRDCLARFPDGKMYDDCRLGLARGLEKLGQTDQALLLYAELAAKADSPPAEAAQFHLGALEYDLGQYEKSIAAFAAFDGRLSRSPWRPNALLGRGLALAKLDRTDEALAQFDAVLDDQTAGGELQRRAARGKARIYLKKNDCAAAVKLLEELLARPGEENAADKDLESRYLLAVGLQGLGRHEAALEAARLVADAAAGRLRADAKLLQGSLLMALKKFAEAVAPLEEFLSAAPNDAKDDQNAAADSRAKALAELSICCARSGKLERAKTAYAEFAGRFEKHPLFGPTTEHLAEAAFAANDPAWSAELSARLSGVGTAEMDFKGRLGVGWSRYKAGKLEEAAEVFDELLKKNPPAEIAAEAAFVRGRILEELNQPEKALEMYDLLIGQYPAAKDRAEALLAAARLSAKQKHPDRAAERLQLLDKDYPQFARLDAALYEWAWAMLEQDKADEAAALFERLHKEHPQSRYWADAVARLAQSALDAKDFRKADALAGELTAKPELDPPLRQYALDLAGQAAAGLDDWPRSRAAFETLIKEFPDSPRRPVAEFSVAESHYRQGELAAAEGLLEKLAARLKELPRQPWMAMVPLRRAQILAQREQWNDAYELAAKIEADFPDFPQQYEVDYLLGRCLASRAEFDAARQAYKKTIESAAGAKTETAAMAQWMIGETFFHQKNYRSAIREYQRVEALYAFPVWQAAALLQAGKCHELLGESREAEQLYRQILSAYAKTPLAEQAAERLEKLGKK